MRIQVLGTGCKKCNELYEHASQAAARLEGGHSVEKVEDVDTFLRMGVLVTPALAIDDQVVSSGRVLSTDDIVALLRAREA